MEAKQTEALRESAMLGVGPMFRGQSLLPAIDHVSILERAGSPILAGGSLDTSDALALIFTICAPWEKVFAASHTMPKNGSGFCAFDDVAWRWAVAEWERSLEVRISSQEVGEVLRAAPLIAQQIAASQFRSLKDGKLSTSDRGGGNWQAPPLARGMKRAWAGLLAAAGAMLCVVGCLMLRGCN